MPDKSPVEKVNDTLDDMVDNVVFGKNEDLFVRAARRRILDKKFGRGMVAFVSAALPGWYAYVHIKEDLSHPEYSVKEKIIFASIDLGIELLLDAYRVGLVYGLYKFDQMIR